MGAASWFRVQSDRASKRPQATNAAIEITGGAATVDQRFGALQDAVGDLFPGIKRR